MIAAGVAIVVADVVLLVGTIVLLVKFWMVMDELAKAGGLE